MMIYNFNKCSIYNALLGSLQFSSLRRRHWLHVCGRGCLKQWLRRSLFSPVEPDLDIWTNVIKIEKLLIWKNGNPAQNSRD